MLDGFTVFGNKIAVREILPLDGCLTVDGRPRWRCNRRPRIAFEGDGGLCYRLGIGISFTQVEMLIRHTVPNL